MPNFIRVTGLTELRSALKGVSALAPEALARANHEVGQVVVEEAKRLAPSGPHQGGGNVAPIASSIHANQAGTNVTVIAGGNKSPHAVVYEFGGTIARAGQGGGKLPYKDRRKMRGANVTHVKKHAYLYPAIAAKQQAIRDKYIEMLDALVLRFRA